MTERSYQTRMQIPLINDDVIYEPAYTIAGAAPTCPNAGRHSAALASGISVWGQGNEACVWQAYQRTG